MAATSYDRFMGRFAVPLAAEFADLLAPEPGTRVLDVGCGPGALTAQLARRLGAGNVRAVDPSSSFVAALRERLPRVEVQEASAESLPFGDDEFGLVAAQLVVHFLRDPVAGLREMGRVARPGSCVAANVWDMTSGTGPLTPFWDSVRSLDPDARAERDLPGVAEGQLVALFEDAGLSDVESHLLTVTVSFDTFDDWWSPYLLGVGPAGTYVSRLDPGRLESVRRGCFERLGPGPFDVTGTAWCALGRA